MTLDQDAASSTPAVHSHTDARPSEPTCFRTLGLVGDSSAMHSLRAEVMRYAPRSATVLITGETGSGKELVARALHELSPRARAPFVAVNVATLRRDLTNSELFGHERGAFTGAVTSHRGLFEQAQGGTLLLDEVGELDAAAQADLLRVLETREVRPIGSSRPRVVDVRVIAATHRDLATMVSTGEFRADLYYRLNVLTIEAPALRDRPDDIPDLIMHLLARLRPEVGPRELTARALAALARHPWPGNVRELLNVLRRATARSDAEVLDALEILDALDPAPSHRRAVTTPAPTPVSTESVTEALRAAGSVAGAARRLGIARSTVRDRLRALQSVRPSP